MTGLVIDDLGLDISQAAMDDEPWTVLGTEDLLADAKSSTRSRHPFLLFLVCHDLLDDQVTADLPAFQ